MNLLWRSAVAFLAIIGGVITSPRAQVVSPCLGAPIFGLGLITAADAQTVSWPCNSTPVVTCTQTGLDFTSACNAIFYPVLW